MKDNSINVKTINLIKDSCNNNNNNVNANLTASKE